MNPSKTNPTKKLNNNLKSLERDEMAPAYAKYRANLKARGITEAEDLAGGNGGKSQIDRWDALFAEAEGLFTIANTDYPETHWLVKNLLPRGTFTLLSGGSKIGKSWLALQLASSVSLGASFLGNPEYPCEQAEVLLLSLQLSSKQLHDRMEVAGILADNRVSVLNQFPRGPEALEAVRYWKMTHDGCQLIIIDMLEQVRNREAMAENSYSENVKEIAAWSQLAQELDITIIALTHDRKIRADDFVNSVLGSTGLVGSSGLVWSLRRSRGKADAILYATGWDIADYDLPLIFDASTGWRLLEGTASEKQESRAREAIREALRESDEPLGIKEIAEMVGASSGSTRWHLCQMKKDGQLSSPSRGKYTCGGTNTNKQTNTHH